MTRIRPAFRAAAALLVAGFSTACIINTSDDDAGQNETGGADDAPPDDDAGDGVTSGVDDGTADGVDDGSDDGPTDGGGFPPECGETPTNVVVDGSFEAGTPSEVWTESSLLFNTPICNTTDCSDDAGAVPAFGEYWAWFGGSETEPEEASLGQTLTIPAGDVAQLSFYLAIPSGAGGGDDILTVSLDQQIVFMVNDQDMADYEPPAGCADPMDEMEEMDGMIKTDDCYRLVEIDVTDFADGGSHELLIEADITGAGLTSFFVDDVWIVSCSESMTDTTAGDETAGTDTGADDTTGGETGTGTDADTGDGSGTDSGTGTTTGN